ncbi:MAG: septum formation initiator family protein [Candidatus Paceibacterota bacterium]|jgi:cell division protein FtsB
MTQGKNERKKRWADRLILLGLVVVLLVVTKATWSLYRKNQMAIENLRSSTERMAKLTEREATLHDKLERLKTARGVEEEIRNNFPVVKEGEQVINIVEEGSVPTTTATTSKSWWQIW